MRISREGGGGASAPAAGGGVGFVSEVDGGEWAGLAGTRCHLSLYPQPSTLHPNPPLLRARLRVVRDALQRSQPRDCRRQLIAQRVPAPAARPLPVRLLAFSFPTSRTCAPPCQAAARQPRTTSPVLRIALPSFPCLPASVPQPLGTVSPPSPNAILAVPAQAEVAALTQQRDHALAAASAAREGVESAARRVAELEA
eukprot:244955-Chlamydomonas_euryale.AAC.3